MTSRDLSVRKALDQCDLSISHWINGYQSEFERTTFAPALQHYLLGACYDFQTVKRAAMSERELLSYSELYRIMKAPFIKMWQAYEEVLELDFRWSLKDYNAMNCLGMTLLLVRVERSDPFGDLQDGPRSYLDELPHREFSASVRKRLAQQMPPPR